MRFFLMMAGLASLVTASPALGQAASIAAPATAEAQAIQPAPEPERLAAAERVVDRIWPLGTFRRVMGATMASVDPMAVASIDSMAWPASTDSKDARRAQHEARTGRPLPGSTNEAPAIDSVDDRIAAMNAALLANFERAEPAVRAALTRLYARHYSLSELVELDTFFATPTGRRYAADSLTMMNDPEIVTAMGSGMDETEAAAAAAADAAAAAAMTTTATSAASKF